MASHSGSSARAIAKACHDGILNATPALFITNNKDAHALDWGKESGLKTLIIPNAEDSEILQALRDHNIDLVVLSGFMKMIGRETIRAYPEKIINVHPSLLPKYGGKGMYGSHIHQAVKDNGDDKTGITIHYVDEIYDNGKIIAQKEIAVSESNSAADIETNVKRAEPDFYVETLKRLLG